jgi:hypothetical protein
VLQSPTKSAPSDDIISAGRFLTPVRSAVVAPEYARSGRAAEVCTEELEEATPRIGRGSFVVVVRLVTHESVAGLLVHDDVARVALLDRGDVGARDPLVPTAEEAQQRARGLAEMLRDPGAVERRGRVDVDAAGGGKVRVAPPMQKPVIPTDEAPNSRRRPTTSTMSERPSACCSRLNIAAAVAGSFESGRLPPNLQYRSGAATA